MKKIDWNELKARAHEVALESPEIGLIEAMAFNKKFLLMFTDRKSFILAYGLAEEKIFDEIGQFTVLDPPRAESFSWDSDIVKVK